MTYMRVIPRDLFNEANLLKCLGRLWILLDETGGHNAKLGTGNYRLEENDYSGAPFQIEQNPNDGSISVENLPFYVSGVLYRLYVPLNCRNPWPLWCESIDDQNTTEFCEPVFCEDGRFHREFYLLISGLLP